jgi:hypothetical protein
LEKALPTANDIVLALGDYPSRIVTEAIKNPFQTNVIGLENHLRAK